MQAKHLNADEIKVFLIDLIECIEYQELPTYVYKTIGFTCIKFVLLIGNYI